MVGLVGVVVLAQACGGGPEAPVVVRPPPLVITGTPPPPPTRAKWVFESGSRSFAGRLDLGASGVLYVGAHGRRELVKGEEPPVDAPTLALDDLVGALRDAQGQYVLVGDDGDTFVAKEPLGAIVSARPGPFANANPSVRVQSLAVGKSVIMAVSPIDGSLVRSTDFGATWSPVSYAGSNKPFGKATSVALDGKGNGLLVHLPQRVFVTHDDGATWAPIASPGIGARRVSSDGGDRLFLEGYNAQRAKLDGNSLAITTEPPQPIFKPTAKPKKDADERADKGEEMGAHEVLAGERVVKLAAIVRHGKKREIEISSSKLGEKSDKTVSSVELLGRDGDVSRHVSAFRSNLIYLRDDDDADRASPTTTVFTSTDWGASWTKGATLEGGQPESDSADVRLGPKGWAFIPALCSYGERYSGGDDDEEGEPSGPSEDCGRRQIRPAGAAAFEDMAFTEDFTPLDFYFDEAHDKVYALGSRKDEKHLYESPLGQNKFVRTKILDGIPGDVSGISVDAKGALRVFAYQYGAGWTVHRHDLDGKQGNTKKYLPLDRGQLVFVGARGLLLASHNHGWETADGGETWIRVATNGAQSAECSDAGCMSFGATRVGWDLPAAAGEEKIALQNDPPAKTPSATAPATAPPPAPPTLTLSCKTTGAATSLPSTPGLENVDARPDARWAYVARGAEGKVSLWVGGRNAAREVPMADAIPKKAPNAKKPDNTEYRTGDRTVADGVVVARYSFQSRSSTGTFNPVDIDLSWFSFSTGKVGHKKLPQLKPFRVPGYGFAGDAQIVQGGVLYQPTSAEPAFFVKDDGKIESITLPPRATVRNALRVGQRWVLEDTEWGTAQISWSDDGGKSWKQKAWSLDEQSVGISLVQLAGKPALALWRSSNPQMIFGLDAAVPDDPPAPTMTNTTTANTTCDAQPGTLRNVMGLPTDKRGNLRVKLDAPKGKDAIELTGTNRVAHALTNGAACTSVYALSGSDQTAYIYADGATWSGWRFRRGDDPKKGAIAAEPVTCAPPKP